MFASNSDNRISRGRFETCSEWKCSCADWRNDGIYCTVNPVLNGNWKHRKPVFGENLLHSRRSGESRLQVPVRNGICLEWGGSYLLCSVTGRFQCILYTSSKAQRDDFFEEGALVDIKRAVKSRTVGRKASGMPWRSLEILVLVVRVPEGYQSCSAGFLLSNQPDALIIQIYC